MITPAFYLPTTVLIIDDDPFFAQTIAELIDDGENFFSIAPEDFEGHESGQIINFQPEGKAFCSTMDTRNVRELVESGEIDKFKEIISVVVIDNLMQPTDGLEFFRRMDSYSIGKVLITSFPHKLKGTKHINSGLIDAQIDKMDADFIAELKSTIQHLKQEFFCKLSLSLNEFHASDNLLLKTGLRETINDIMISTKTNFYIASQDFKEMSFYDRGHTKRTTVRLATLEELQSFRDSYQAETIPKEMMSLITSGSLMPWLNSDDFPEHNDWSKFLSPAHGVKGHQEIFYSLRATT